MELLAKGPQALTNFGPSDGLVPKCSRVRNFQYNRRQNVFVGTWTDNPVVRAGRAPSEPAAAYAVPRAVVDAFYQVYAARDVESIARCLHDDIVWTISGPIDLLPFCGTHCGKAAVLDLIGRQVPAVLRTYSFVPESILVEGDRAAALSRQCSRRTEDNRAISYRVANFMRFCDDKLLENLSLMDSFDAVEQVLGHSLDVSGTVRRHNGGLVAV